METDLRAPGSAQNVVDFPEQASAQYRRKRRLKIWVGAIAVVLVLALIYILAQFTPWLALKQIRVQGAQLSATADIERRLSVLDGTALTHITQKQVKQLLSDVQTVQNVHIAAQPPSTLVVDVTERRPVAVVKYADNSFELIDKDGVQLKSVGSQAEAKLPLIDGGRSATQSEVFTTITTVLQSLPPQILSQLSAASARSTSSVTLTLTNGVTVQWGDAQDNTLKGKILALLLAQPAQDPPVKEIDVSAPDSPVTR